MARRRVCAWQEGRAQEHSQNFVQSGAEGETVTRDVLTVWQGGLFVQGQGEIGRGKFFAKSNNVKGKETQTGNTGYSWACDMRGPGKSWKGSTAQAKAEKETQSVTLGRVTCSSPGCVTSNTPGQVIRQTRQDLTRNTPASDMPDQAGCDTQHPYRDVTCNNPAGM
eukprot:1155010-Pelagomonas_calceolata.AAC.2